MKTLKALVLFCLLIWAGMTVSCQPIMPTDGTIATQPGSNKYELTKTDTRSFDTRKPCIVELDQKHLLDTDFILRGKYTSSENYTLTAWSDNTPAEEYYTVFHFTVTDIYKGSEGMLGKDIPVVVMNFGGESINELLLNEGQSYLLFARDFINPTLQEAFGGELFTVSLSQTVFEDDGYQAYVSNSLLGFTEDLASYADDSITEAWARLSFSVTDAKELPNYLYLAKTSTQGSTGKIVCYAFHLELLESLIGYWQEYYVQQGSAVK